MWRSDAHTDPWSQLGRSELTALGKSLVTERLEALGCTVTPPRRLTDGRLEVLAPSGRALEVFVSTQRVGGYAFWTKRRLQIAPSRLAVIVLLTDAGEPDVYLVPTTEWLSAGPPFTNRDNIGKKSEPEFGVSLARSSLPALERYLWDDGTARESFR